MNLGFAAPSALTSGLRRAVVTPQTEATRATSCQENTDAKRHESRAAARPPKKLARLPISRSPCKIRASLRPEGKAKTRSITSRNEANRSVAAVVPTRDRRRWPNWFMGAPGAVCSVLELDLVTGRGYLAQQHGVLEFGFF